MDVWNGGGCKERLWMCGMVVDVKRDDGCMEL